MLSHVSTFCPQMRFWPTFDTGLESPQVILLANPHRGLSSRAKQLDQSRTSGLGLWRAIEPANHTDDIHSSSRGKMLQMGPLLTDGAGAAQTHRTHSL